jgi:hypothetical protein
MKISRKAIDLVHAVLAEVLLDEDQQESDRVQVPCLDEDRRDHQPAGPPSTGGALLVHDPVSRLIGQFSEFGFGSDHRAFQEGSCVPSSETMCGWAERWPT